VCKEENPSEIGKVLLLTKRLAAASKRNKTPNPEVTFTIFRYVETCSISSIETGALEECREAPKPSSSRMCLAGEVAKRNKKEKLTHSLHHFKRNISA
jgi:hypothetical protein